MEAPPMGMGHSTEPCLAGYPQCVRVCVCVCYDCCVLLRKSDCTYIHTVRETGQDGGRLLLSDQATLEMMTRGSWHDNEARLFPF